MSSVTLTTTGISDPPPSSIAPQTDASVSEQPHDLTNVSLFSETPSIPSERPANEDGIVGHLASVGGYLSSSALSLVKKSGEVASSLAASTSSAIGTMASSVSDTAKSASQATTATLVFAGNQGATLASTALGQVYSTGEALLEAGVDMGAYVASETLNSAVSSTRWLYDTSLVASERTGAFMADKFLDLIENAGALLTKHVAAPVGGTVVSAFDTLAVDSTTPSSVHMRAARAVAGFLPITGGAKEIGKAREVYRIAQSLPPGTEKESKLHQARRDCLIATVSLSVDVISYFATAGTAQAIKTGSTALSALSIAKGIKENSLVNKWLPPINIDLLSPQADLALRSPVIREAMEIILRQEPTFQHE